MGSHRHGMAAVALALCLGVLGACGGGSDQGSGPDRSVQPPRSTQTGGTPDGRGPTGGSNALEGKVIVIDPGHNGGNARHPGEINRLVFVGNGRKPCDTTGTSTNDGYSEHAFTWDVSKRLAKLLRERGAEVKLTRENDVGVGPCITERAGIANRAKADAAISIHGDGAPASGHGFHVIEPIGVPGFNTRIVGPSRTLGTAIRDAFHEGTGLPFSTYRGTRGIDRRNDLGGLNLSKVPKVFIECGNMRNSSDAAKMRSAAFRQRMAESLANGFAAYLAR
ncbi:N-acetylmuramoyl-L-alanine amidase [Actinomadura sp. NBRC 104412]|nr:N-acetylmuramoyl-L-alanine amidase [Actinomadura sp. NBRC 104412]